MKTIFSILIFFLVLSCGSVKNYEIEELDLSNKGLRKLPNNILNYHKLKSINLRNNRLKIFPAELSELHNLETLIISDNLIDSIPIEILKLKKLKNLYIDDNSIKYFRDLSSLKDLRLITITNNPLRTIDEFECFIPLNSKILHTYDLSIIQGEDCTQ